MYVHTYHAQIFIWHNLSGTHKKGIMLVGLLFPLVCLLSKEKIQLICSFEF
jgi:hypothetical protein